MQRFHRHRFWTIVLASCLATGAWSASPEIARAIDFGIDGDPDFRTPSAPPPPTGTGDPDMPSGTSRSTPRTGVTRGGAGQLRGQSAPTGVLSEQAVWTLRLWIALRTVRSLQR